jgi:endogenous inhibitor of DNA gyrase (YacG/DUF329 family)
MKCPNCGQPVEWKDNPTRPFCSERCKLIDFGRWANEEYSIPVEETPLAETEDPPSTPSPHAQPPDDGHRQS